MHVFCYNVDNEKGGDFLPLRFKIDILEALKEKGYTTYILRKNNLLSQSTLQKLREGKGLAWENISRICEMLNCQPGDILEYVPQEKTLDNYD